MLMDVDGRRRRRRRSSFEVRWIEMFVCRK
jgi:hypothetical protein